MKTLGKIISWIFIVFGGLMLLASVVQLYEGIYSPKTLGQVVSPALFGVAFLSVGLRLKKRGTL